MKNKQRTAIKSGLLFTLVTMLFCLSARADWSLQPNLGQVYLSNSGSQLNIVGPTGNYSSSYDIASITAPALSNPSDKWEYDFHWVFNVGDSAGSLASIYYPSISGGNPFVLGSGGPGESASGNYFLILNQGETAQILLSSDVTGAGKQPSSLRLTPYGVPEAPSFEAALILALIGFGWRLFPKSAGNK